MALFTLRAAGEVREPQFGSVEGALNAEMMAIAAAIIRQRTGNFDPSTHRRRRRIDEILAPAYAGHVK
jgi:non-homologous end joining protein Ku